MLDVYGVLNRYFLYPFYYWKNSDKRLSQLKKLERQQYLQPSELESLQLKKLKRIVSYAYHNTSYYKRIMDERGLSPDFIVSLKDIERLPILTKKIIQENTNDLISKQYNKSELIQDASGGSTGEPTLYYKDLRRHNIRRADQIRHDRWSGWDIGKRSALIWGAQRDLKSIQSKKEHIISRYIARHWELDAFEMTPQKMDYFVAELERVKPSMILGYANALTKFAEYVIKNHPKHKIKLDGIISSAETLTANKRKTIESAFHCKVLNRYGSREVGLIASECKQQSGLHINADNLYVEITKGDNSVLKGSSGDVVVTDFLNYGMPFIRYNLGDVGYMSADSCSCGRTLPLLGAIEGRTGDFFTAKTGTLIHGEYFTHLFYGVPEIKQFQMVQNTLESIDLKIVKSDLFRDEDILSPIVIKIKEMLGEQSKVNIIYLDEIPKPASGKSIFTISHVTQDGGI